MPLERERRNGVPNETTKPGRIRMNVGTLNNEEEVRETLMERYNSGESVIQPPNSNAGTLGSAIKTELERYR